MTPDQLLVSVRRRLRRARATTMAGWWGWIPALIGVVVIFAARHVNWVLLEPLGLFIMVAGVMGLAAWGWSRRFSDLQVARTADAGLGTKDALSAHVEFRADGPHDRADPEWMRLIERRAVVAAASGDAKGASPRWRFSRLRLMGLALFSVLAAALMIAANPQDRVRAHERAARQVQEHAMAEIDRASEELDRGSDAHKAMAELVEKLRTADPAQALELMREAQAQLLDSAGKGLESARAAAEGLDASLRTDPLPGTDGGTASEQLDTLAGNLGTLDDEQRELLVERLKALAATQVAGSPDVAAVLGDAADAVASGSQGASDALTRAAGAQRRMSAAVAQRAASAAAAQTVGEAARAMADALSPSSGMPGSQVASGTAGSAVQPGGRNPGGGMPGGGQGQGNQPGSGQGQGNQPGGGQGNQPGGGGGGLRSGSATAQGGPGKIGNGTGTGSDPGRRAEGAEESDGRVFAPDPSARLGANGPASAEGGDLSNSAGKDDTASRVGSARVPLSEAVRRYSGGATRAAAQPGLPPAHRALISDYFARLSAGS